MNIIVLGATGGTGIEIVERALERGHSVTAFVRSPDALAKFDSKIRLLEGNPIDVRDLARVIPGHDAVLSALGPRDPKRHEALVAPFARSLTSAMAQCGCDRLIILSVAFLFKNAILPPAYPAGQLLFKHHVEDCAEMENVVRASDLDWTIVRPPQLTNKPRADHYRVTAGKLPFLGFTASRAAVADLMIRSTEEHGYSRQIVGIAG